MSMGITSVTLVFVVMPAAATSQHQARVKGNRAPLPAEPMTTSTRWRTTRPERRSRSSRRPRVGPRADPQTEREAPSWAHSSCRSRRGSWAVGYSRLSGSRELAYDGTVYDLGIPLMITRSPLDLGCGWRFAHGRTLHSCAGSGVTIIKHQEESDFSDDQGNVNDVFTGFCVAGGVEVTLARSAQLRPGAVHESSRCARHRRSVSRLQQDEPRRAAVSIRLAIRREARPAGAGVSTRSAAWPRRVSCPWPEAECRSGSDSRPRSTSATASGTSTSRSWGSEPARCTAPPSRAHLSRTNVICRFGTSSVLAFRKHVPAGPAEPGWQRSPPATKRARRIARRRSPAPSGWTVPRPLSQHRGTSAGVQRRDHLIEPPVAKHHVRTRGATAAVA